jgi:RNA polymerase sigma-70 factor, ECF subfamily
VAPDTIDQGFSPLFEPHRRELLTHCYRMLGSFHDAEDVVQEVYLRASRAHDRFEGRSSLRTWLYRIATRACLTALERRSRRPLPADLGGSGGDPDGSLTARPEVPWLEPLPDARGGVGQSDPAAIVTQRQAVRLAFVAALQHLPPRQRAVLILRDVLRCRTEETAAALATTADAVDSGLRRARARLARVAPQEHESVEPTAPDLRRVLDRYVAAFEAKDVDALVDLFAEDVTWEMPPYTVWFRGREAVGRHLRRECPDGPGDLRLVPTAANGQPAFALYQRGGDGVHRAVCLHVLDVTAAGRIGRVVVFGDPRLVAACGLPATWPADRRSGDVQAAAIAGR